VAAPLPSGTRVEREEGRLRIVLPHRPLGKGRCLGLFLIPFGAVFAGGPLAASLAGFRSEGGCMGVVILLFALPFVVVGLLLFAFGVAVLFPNRAAFALDRSTLSVRERLGPFRWTWKADRDKVEAFRVRKQSAASGQATTGVIEVRVRDRRKPFTMGSAYPEAWLSSVAEALSGAHGRAPLEPAIEAPPTAALPPASLTDVGAQPEGSDAVFEYQADSVRLFFPARGVWKANGCLLLFGIGWTAFSLVFMVAALSGGFRSDLGTLGGLAFVMVFVAVGAALTLGALQSGRKTAAVELGPSSLVVRTIGIFGRKVREWPRKELRAFEVGDSGWKVNDVVQWELRVGTAGGKPLKLLRGRSREELEWVAATLRAGAVGRMETPELRLTEAECQVCNSPLAEGVVSCARCRTPHHEQCWQYMGQCSTYGCREIRFVRKS